MAHALGTIKSLTFGTIKIPLTVAGKATRTAAALTSGLVGRAMPGPTGRADRPGTAPVEPPQPTPVNVVEELGLDPAPLAEAPQESAVTSIDEAADPDAVEVTPADIASSVAKQKPVDRKAGATPARKQPAARKSPARTSSPSGKLPTPR